MQQPSEHRGQLFKSEAHASGYGLTRVTGEEERVLVAADLQEETEFSLREVLHLVHVNLVDLAACQHGAGGGAV